MNCISCSETNNNMNVYNVHYKPKTFYVCNECDEYTPEHSYTCFECGYTCLDSVHGNNKLVDLGYEGFEKIVCNDCLIEFDTCEYCGCKYDETCGCNFVPTYSKRANNVMKKLLNMKASGKLTTERYNEITSVIYDVFGKDN